MKIKSAIITEASGSVGGLTASHNRGGLYLRARVIPVNPNTVQQQEIRSLVAMLTSRWQSILTELQRASWDLYALNVPLPDRLGEPRNVGGIAMYVRSNVPRLQDGLDLVDTAPFIFDLGSYTPPSVSVFTAAGNSFQVFFDGFGVDTWPAEDGAAMLIYTSRAQSLAVNFFKGPYRLSDRILGDSAIPPTSPFTATPAFALVEGTKIFVRVNVSRVDGRLGTENRSFGIVVA
jgi:hypothetical protein